jgi:predicted ATP-grasp superfamily ATP-dependent carboligase
MIASTSQQVPALIMGENDQTLGALRCLQLAGVPTYVACPPRELVIRSRWYRSVPGGNGWDGTVGPDINAILEALPLDQAVLFPCMDDATIWAADFGNAKLRQRFLVSSSSRKVLETLQDKARFAAFLEANDIPHPPTFPLRDPRDIDAVPFEQFDRMFLKPTNSQKFSRTLGRKAMWASSRSEFERLWHALQVRELEVVAQEYVPGEATEHYFLDGFRDRYGALPGLFARRRLRIFPPDFGNSSYCQSIPLSEVAPAEAHLRKLLAALDYRGIFSAEFKRDARNNEFRILEVNIRPWRYVEFAARCGVNVCRMAYDDARGKPVAPISNYRTGAGCVHLPTDIKMLIGSNRRERGSLRKIPRQWMRAHYTAFRLNDPLPGIVAVFPLFSQAWHRITKGPARRQDPPYEDAASRQPPRSKLDERP